ncbi:SseB family protein [Leifsonia sp. NPDC058230]|uniref:SseB family protein n=1 Tax=Leifsonia sp. NPDC058230 TaxID=3346391 RepID=UPI0036D8B595
MGLFSRRRADGAVGKRSGERDVTGEPAAEQIVTNRLLQAALSRWTAGKDTRTFADVLRQCVTGSLLLDGSGSTITDPDRGLRPGDTIGVGYRTDEQGRHLLLAFTSTERMSAYHQGERAVSLVQPASTVMAQAVSDFDGIAIDAGSADLCIAFSDEIRRHLTDDPTHNEPLKTALVERSIPWEDLLDLLGSTSSVFIAMSDVRDDSGTVTGVTVPTARGKNGETYSVAFTSPAEVWAWSPPENAQASGIADVARAAREQRHDGVLLNPAGQSVVISPPELERFLV